MRKLSAIGAIRGTRFRVCGGRALDFVLSGRVEPSAKGCAISAEIRISRLAAALFACWLVGTMVFICYPLCLSRVTIALGGVAMAIDGACGLVALRLSAKEQAPRLSAFLRRLYRDVEKPDAASPGTIKPG